MLSDPEVRETVKAYGPLITAVIAALVAFAIAGRIEEQRRRTAASETRKSALAKMLPSLRSALMAALGRVEALWEMQGGSSPESRERAAERANQEERDRHAAIQEVLGFAAEYGKLPPGVAANHRHLIDHAQRWGFNTAASPRTEEAARRATAKFRADLLALYDHEDRLSESVGRPRKWKHMHGEAITMEWIEPFEDEKVRPDKESGEPTGGNQ